MRNRILTLLTLVLILCRQSSKGYDGGFTFPTSIEINSKNQNFTINTLFTTILRDVQRDYVEKDNIQILTIKGA